MRIRATIAIALLLLLASCKPAEEGHAKAILGAVLIDGAGGPPLTDSVVLVSGDRIRAVGARSNIPIPADADRVNGAGKYLVPGLIDVCDRAEPPGMLHPSTPEQARTQVAELVSRKPAAIYAGGLSKEVSEALFDAARAASVPVIARVSTQAEVKQMLDGGAAGFLGMIRDTEEIDPVLLANLRNLRLFFAPALTTAGDKLDVAKRNTERLFRAGVPIAVASLGGDYQKELDLLVSAGIPPFDVLVSATRNGATALRLADRGVIEAEKRADLLLLTANPGEEIRNLRQIALRMESGGWVR